ncbi:hypothetical protein AB0D94_10615 [Streptomyces sp. NPDC048255]|uniref:hypothetical protein n=1 Tax=Streptomyces sp. NPDC048255 TaxID=3154713 RepID=UPI0033F706DF
MAVLTTIALILGAWCAASVVTAALYAALRSHQVRRQRAVASALGATVGRCAPERPAREPKGGGIVAWWPRTPHPRPPQEDLSLRF